MTLVVEVIQPNGERSRYQLNGLPLTIGRAVANDIVLDDPYADATHARLTMDETGAIVVEDLASLNGVVTNDERLRGRLLARPGDVVRVGRTTLRFRDPNESLPPALVDGPTVAPASHRRLRMTPAAAGLLLLLLAMTTLAFSSWLGSSTRSSANDAVTAALGAAMLVGIWCGLWSVASRIIVHQFRFMRHVAVASVVVMIGLAWSVTENWLQFFFPDSALVTVPSYVVSLALLAGLVAGHLALASTMPRRGRLRIGVIVSAVVLAISGLAAVTKDDSFSDVPKFPAVMKPVSAALVPTKSIDQFESVAQQIKQQVDQLAKK
jgi:hypothetical protein